MEAECVERIANLKVTDGVQNKQDDAQTKGQKKRRKKAPAHSHTLLSAAAVTDLLCERLDPGKRAHNGRVSPCQCVFQRSVALQGNVGPGEQRPALLVRKDAAVVEQGSDLFVTVKQRGRVDLVAKRVRKDRVVLRRANEIQRHVRLGREAKEQAVSRGLCKLQQLAPHAQCHCAALATRTRRRKIGPVEVVVHAVLVRSAHAEDCPRPANVCG